MFVKSYDNFNLYVHTSGNDKEPLLFIHGGPGAWSYSFEYFAKDYINQFANGIYLDQRGCGRSEGSEAHDYSIESLIKDIESVRLALGYEKINIIAHSFGGIIALSYTLKYQEHVNKLILSNCTLYLDDSIKEQIDYGFKLLNETPSYENLMDTFQHMYRRLSDLNIYTNLQFKDPKNADLLSQIDSGKENYTFNRLALGINDYLTCYYDLTKEVKVPTLIISGKNDYAVGPNHYKHFMFPNSMIKEMDTMHVPFIEDQEEYFKIIQDFIDN